MISVIIPLYNKAHTIVDTINSVLNQTYQDFELIIVNDGSIDNGVELIQQRFSDDRIRIIHQKNAGASAARNRGVGESRSNYVTFLDGDDEWHPEYLSIVENVIIKYPEAGMVCTGGVLCNKKNPDEINYRLSSKYLNKIVKVNYFENPFVFSNASAMTVRKDVFYKVQGFPVGIKFCEDYICAQKIALITPTVYIGLPLSKYNGGVEGQTTSSNDDIKFSHFQDVVDYYNLVMSKYVSENSSNSVFKTFFQYDIRHRIKLFLKNRDYRRLNYFFNNLSVENLGLLFPFELYIYKKKLRNIGILWINVTKILWRMNRYPIMGEQINPNKIKETYRKW